MSDKNKNNSGEKKAKSLTVRIFINTFITGALVYFVCAVLFISNMYSYFEKQIFEELEVEATYLKPLAENNQLEELQLLNTKNRITLIRKDGTVYFDSKADPSKMENHATRYEFIQAQQEGNSSVSRFSSTMTEKTLYHAELLSSGDVLRVSCNQHSVAVLVFGMSQTLILMLIIAVVISGFSASLISKKITEPLNHINLEDPEKSAVYEELKPFTRRIAEENFEKSQREELRQQFSANVSHELKTPLTSISGFAEILKAGETDKQTTIDFASTIYDESQRMINLVNDIIKLSKLDEKSISQEKEPLSLREIAMDAFNVLNVPAKKKNVALNLYGDSGNINGVRSVVYEMVYNLIDNGIKYNRQDGKVDVNIETFTSEINGRKTDTRVVLTVADTGIGIPESEQDRVFERFYRVDKSRSKELGGTGLGLSIVKHGAKYHNASVLLSSKEGEGSTFTLIFNI